MQQNCKVKDRVEIHQVLFILIIKWVFCTLFAPRLRVKKYFFAVLCFFLFLLQEKKGQKNPKPYYYIAVDHSLEISLIFPVLAPKLEK